MTGRRAATSPRRAAPPAHPRSRRRPARRTVAVVAGVLVLGALGTAAWMVRESDSAGTGSYIPIVNPDAESGSCGTGGSSASAQGWTATSGDPQQVCYGAVNFPAASQGPPSPGGAFFDGGASATASMTQTDAVGGAAAEIGTGAGPFTFSAWLGGFSFQPDDVTVTADFLSASGSTLGSATLAPVTAADRGNQTKFLERTATGIVPLGTTSVRFTVDFVRSDGFECDGYVDDIAMKIGS